MEKNVAQTSKYLQLWQAYERLFEMPVVDQKEITLDNGRYCVEILEYRQQAAHHQTGQSVNMGVSRYIITDQSGKTLAEIKSLDDHHLINFVRHQNGHDYLIYRIDLYGYSVMDLTTGKQIDYFPESGLYGGEPFIWCETTYCSVNNLLAVGGCYWACPYSYQFYDFSNPMQLPLPMYCDLTTLEREFDFEIKVTDNTIITFTEIGECVIEQREQQQIQSRHIIDVSKRMKQE